MYNDDKNPMDDFYNKTFRVGRRKIDFVYHLLDENNQFVRELDNVISGKVSYDMEANIKRTAKFTLVDDGTIDFLNHRIMPIVRIQEPGTLTIVEKKDDEKYAFLNPYHVIEHKYEVVHDTKGGVWYEMPVGVFILSSPTREDEYSLVQRNVDAYDISLLLDEHKVERSFTIKEGQPYVATVEALLRQAGIHNWHITPDFRGASRTIEYSQGTSFLTIINDLLKQIGYTALSFTSFGDAVAFPFYDLDERKVTHKYHDDEESLTLVGVKETLDLSKAYNTFTVVMSNEDQPPKHYTYVNDNPNDPLSTVNRKRNIVYTERIDDISDEGALEMYTRRVASEMSTQLGTITFRTPIVPNHCCYNVIDFKYRTLGIHGKFLEVSWDMELEVGGVMTHTLQLKHESIGGEEE